jgi:hypothetical protein
MFLNHKGIHHEAPPSTIGGCWMQNYAVVGAETKWLITDATRCNFAEQNKLDFV